VTRAALIGALALSALAAGACAARVPPRPQGAAAPDPASVEAFAAATAACKGVRTMSGALRLSGHAGAEKLRGTLLTGLAAPASVRFEAVAPFGQPVFILAGRDNRATLLLPRESRVLRDAALPAVLERLTGLNLTAADLRLLLTGCLSEAGAASDGKRYADGGWRSVIVDAGANGPAITAYLRAVNGTTSVVAADYGDWRVDYAEHLNGFPRRVRLRSAAGGDVDLSAAIDELQVNAGLDDKAFEVAVPDAARVMTLDDLRSVAPLRDTR
jgi:outer membrane lipoprotein-sorting protein